VTELVESWNQFSTSQGSSPGFCVLVTPSAGGPSHVDSLSSTASHLQAGDKVRRESLWGIIVEIVAGAI